MAPDEMVKKLAEQELELLLLRKGGTTTPKLTAAEALYGFGGWLTSREAVCTFSEKHDAGVMADLIGYFAKVNELEDPRPGWESNLTHPKGDAIGEKNVT